ncbi:MAG: CdaR family protein [Coprobacillus sp.]
MSPRKEKKELQDSTTEFFLKVVQKEKDQTSKESNTMDTLSSKRTKTLKKFGNFYNYINQILDKILASKLSVMILSLLMAGVLFWSITGGDFLVGPTSGDILKDVTVNVEGLDDSLELTGVPEKVNVALIGPSLDIYTTKLTKNYEVYLDLKDFEKGEYTVNLKGRNFPNTLQVMVIPESLKIKLAPKVTAKFDLGYRFTNEDKLDSKYSVSVEEMAVSNVTVRAGQETLQKIAKVEACIDVSEKNDGFEQDAKIKAFDKNGRELNVEIAPTTVHVKCQVTSYNKVVDVKANFVGEIPQGYQIANYSLSQKQVTIYGLEEKIKDITEVRVDVDVNDLKATSTMSGLTIKKDVGINKLSTDTVDVNVEIEKVITKKFEKIPITVLNNSKNYNVSFAGEGSFATVAITGSESKLATFTADNIQATVDIDGLRVGTRKVNVNVATDDEKLKIELLSSSKVTINIERN